MVDVVIVGCGFIGTTLAKFLSKKMDVVTLDVLPQPDSLKNLNIPHKTVDVRNRELLKQEIGTPKVIIHTAIIQIPQIIEEKQLGYDVNVVGTQNLCEIVSSSDISGMILISSWHTYGERELDGIIQEDIGYFPDNVEERAKLYALSKTIQECMIRFFDEKDDTKLFGAIKIGTALGNGMPKGTAANIFIQKAISGESITPFKHSMNRPMFYVSVDDICKTTEKYIDSIINQTLQKTNSIDHIMNVAYPDPISILDLANFVKDSVQKHSDGKTIPEISIIDKSIPEIGSPDDKNKIHLDVSKIKKYLGIDVLQKPQDVIDDLVKSNMALNE